MRLREFWTLMDGEFGPSYARSVAVDQHLSDLGGRTVADALEAGVEPSLIWRAVCDAMQVPDERRWGIDPNPPKKGGTRAHT